MYPFLESQVSNAVIHGYIMLNPYTKNTDVRILAKIGLDTAGNEPVKVCC